MPAYTIDYIITFSNYVLTLSNPTPPSTNQFAVVFSSFYPHAIYSY